MHVGYDSYPQWLSAAVEHAERCWNAAQDVDKVWPTDNENAKVAAVEVELRHGMQTFVSAAACMDGFYAASKHLMVQEGFKANSKCARHRAISELFRQGYLFDDPGFAQLTGFLKTLFDGRDEAVHPRSAATEPVAHPRLAVNRQIAIFSAENSLQVMDSTANLLDYLIAAPRTKYPKLEEIATLGKSWLRPVIEQWREKRAGWLTVKKASEAGTRD